VLFQVQPLVPVGHQFTDLDVSGGEEPGTCDRRRALDPHGDRDERVEHPARPSILGGQPSGHEQPTRSQRPLTAAQLIHCRQPLTEVAVDRNSPDFRRFRPEIHVPEGAISGQFAVGEKQAQRGDG
jgi:hypothetical protein